MPGLLLTAETAFTVSVLLEIGTSVLTWILTCFGDIFSFAAQHTAVFCWIALSLIGGVFIFWKKFV